MKRLSADDVSRMAVGHQVPAVARCCALVMVYDTAQYRAGTSQGCGDSMSETPGPYAGQPRSAAHASTAAYPAPRGKGCRLWWLVGAAAVLVVAASACTANTNTTMAGSGGSWNPRLPNCTQLSAALPGDAPLVQNYRSSGTESVAGSGPINIASLRCYSGQVTGVSVDIFDSSAYDPATLSQYAPPRPYRDGKVHDGPGRAQAQFALETKGLTVLSPTEAYGSQEDNGGECTTAEVKQNVVVIVMFAGRGTSAQQRQANCRKLGAQAVASVLQRIG
jgi:hypothetical protein